MSTTVISVENLGKRYRIYDGTRARYKTVRESVAGALLKPFRRGQGERQQDFWALHNVSFEVGEGEVIGVIGRNGAGKSTLLKLLSRITEPTEGRARVRGRVGSLLEVGTGFHPELTGRENIYLSGAILGMKQAEIARVFDEIVEFSEVGQFLDTPLKRYSSGMYLRLAFGVAAHLEPDILFIDEVLAVGDAAFQKKCIGKMSEVSRGGRTVLIVSHNMGVISTLCSRGILLSGGRIEADGPVREVVHLALSEQKETGHTDQELDRVRMRGYGQSVKFTSMTMVNEGGGTVLFQDGLRFRFSIKSDRRYRNLKLAGTIRNALGGPVGTLFTEDSFDIEAGQTIELELAIDNFNLAPDYYMIGFSIGIGGRSEHWQNLDIAGAIPFQVVLAGKGDIHLAWWEPATVGNVLIPKTRLTPAGPAVEAVDGATTA